MCLSDMREAIHRTETQQCVALSDLKVIDVRNLQRSVVFFSMTEWRTCAGTISKKEKEARTRISHGYECARGRGETVTRVATTAGTMLPGKLQNTHRIPFLITK